MNLCSKIGFLFILSLVANTVSAQPQNPTEYPYGGIPDSTRFDQLIMANSPVDFNQMVNYRNAKFHKLGDFINAYYHGKADYSLALFDAPADFNMARFFNLVDFIKVKFNHPAKFEKVYFELPANFSNSEYKNYVNFRFAEFKDQAGFFGIDFIAKADFMSNDFAGLAYFTSSVFNDIADFRQTSFHTAEFFQTQFKGLTNFQNTKFDSLGKFSKAQFDTLTIFEKSTFLNEADFSNAVFKGDVRFSNSALKSANFRSAQFNRQSIFDHVSFNEADFRDVTFPEQVDFNEAQFKNWVDFGHATFKKGVDFRNTKLTNSNFNYANLGGTILLGDPSNPQFDFYQTVFTEDARLVLCDLVDLQLPPKLFNHLFFLDSLSYSNKRFILDNLKKKSYASDKRSQFELDYLFAKSTLFQDQFGDEKGQWFHIWKWPGLVGEFAYQLTMGLGYRPFRLVFWALMIVLFFAVLFRYKFPDYINHFIDANYSTIELSLEPDQTKYQHPNFLNCLYFSAMVLFSLRLKGSLLTSFEKKQKRVIIFEWIVGWVILLSFLFLSKPGSIYFALSGFFAN